MAVSQKTYLEQDDQGPSRIGAVVAIGHVSPSFMPGREPFKARVVRLWNFSRLVLETDTGLVPAFV